VRLGKEEPAVTQIDNDYELVMRLFSRHKKRTAKQLREAIEIPVVRAEAAIARLEERGRIKNISGSGSTTAYALAE
jgi:predicted HTH transcriptional regulator